MKKKSTNKVNIEKDVLYSMLGAVEPIYLLTSISERIDDSMCFWEEEIAIKEDELAYEDELKSVIRNEIKGCNNNIKLLNELKEKLKDLQKLMAKVDLA